MWLFLIIVICILYHFTKPLKCPRCKKRFETKAYNPTLQRFEYQCDSCGFKINNFENE
jgi:transposase-like protein